MSNIAVLGTQWGDEGKGKLTDLLTPSFDIVARFQGGHNAGHTVYVNGQKIILHLIPSGILHPDKLCLIGNGLVINPQAFLDEKAALERFGISIGDNLAISTNAHLILPYHTQVESLREENSLRKIGTTSRGIGPAYVDKVARQGIKAGDLLNLAVLKDKIEHNVEEKNIYLVHHGKKQLAAQQVFEDYAEYAALLGPYIKDVSYLLDQEIRQGKSILYEGAQGTLLDIDHGTYPYVTSSNSTVGGICSGLGIGPDKIDEVWGVAKAYTTRVGKGPFPTEARDEWGEYLREHGQEYGATTGRPRRCGWFDAVLMAYSCRLNGIKKLLLTKADVLDGLQEIQVCTGYAYKGETLPSFPLESWVLEEAQPIYQAVKGWQTPVSGGSEYDELPREFRDYVSLIEDLLEVEVALISTGVGRGDTVLRRDVLQNLIDLDTVIAEI
jgi:adenylosuccinate synthase